MATLYGSKPHVHFEVEKVIGVSSDGNYRVQWAPAWVSKFHLVGCEHLIQEFLHQQSEKEMNCDPLQDNASEQHCRDKEIDSVNTNNDMNNGLDACPTTYANEYQHNESYVDSQQQLNDSHTYIQVQNDAEYRLNQSAVVVKIEDDDEEGSCTDLEDYGNPCFNNRVNTDVHTSTSLPTTSITMGNDESVPGSTSKSDVHGTSNQMSLMQVDGNPKKEFISPVTEDRFLSFKMTEVFSETYSRQEGKPHSCSYCYRSYSTKAHLRRHLLSHTGEKAHQCHLCEKAFSRGDVLKAHMLTHTNPVFNCGICGRVFKCSSFLEKHHRTHHAIMD